MSSVSDFNPLAPETVECPYPLSPQPTGLLVP